MTMKKYEMDTSLWKIGKRNMLEIIFSRTMLIMLLIVLQFTYIIARMYAWAEHIPILLGGELIVVGIMMAIILNSKDNPSVKLSWCFLVGVFPILGSVIYFVITYDLGYRVLQKRIKSAEAVSRKYIPLQENVRMELKEKDIQTYRMAQYLQKTNGSLVSKNSNVRYFSLGDEMFEEMKKQLETAKEFIFLEYFMIAPGKMWNEILKILIRKATEGVDVRVLYDGTCSIYLLPYKYPEYIEKTGVKCRMFSPPIPFLSTHYNNRDHRKIMVIDGKIAFTGGVNIGDEYINVDSPFGHWKDVGIMLDGDAVFGFTTMFLQMWSATDRKHGRVLELSDMEKYLGASSYFLEQEGVNLTENLGYVIPYADNPVDDENIGKSVYIDILNQAKEYVYIMTPYLILDGEMLTAICFAAKRGVDVRIILPHIPDKWYAFVLAQSNYKVLLESGVKIYEYTPGFVHGKVFLSDDERAVIGSINLDYRSLYWHYECSAYLYQVPVLKEIYEDFLNTQKLCEIVTSETIKNIGFVSKFAAYILKIVAPLM